jgi:hypothetical protein
MAKSDIRLFSQRRPDFNPWAVYKGFPVGKMALGHGFIRAGPFLLSSANNNFYIPDAELQSNAVSIYTYSKCVICGSV